MEYAILDDLKYIKKKYGEKMEHLCRELFPSILEYPGMLYHIISSHFAKSRNLYWDIVNEHKEYLFKEYIYSFADIERKNSAPVNKSVKELLSEAGYELYECKTNEDIWKFRKYYASGEALCTFIDPDRINGHYIFFIVKKDADKLKREDFSNPKREDEYSLSVLDIQFDKGKRQRVSIKSRYNHTVTNPDAVYSNNLECITPGLTTAFEQEYNFNIGENYRVGFELDHYVESRNEKFYKYNYELNNIHYGIDNIIIDNGKVIDKYTDKSRYLIMDYFILDLQEKEIKLYDKKIRDSFIDGLKDIPNIVITNMEGYKEIKIILVGEKEAIIKVDKDNRIISYENNELTDVEDWFLAYNRTLTELSLPNLKKCGRHFLYWNETLTELSLSKLESCGNTFLFNNRMLTELSLPNLTSCGVEFLHCNRTLTKLSLPNLTSCGSDFLYNNRTLTELSLPNLASCGSSFLVWNETLTELSLPNLTSCGNAFLGYNETLTSLTLPNLASCGNDFLYFNGTLMELSLPNLASCGNNFLFSNKCLTELSLPNLKKCGSSFICSNKTLTSLSLPSLVSCEENFLFWNETLKELSLPNLTSCGVEFLFSNKCLTSLSLPNLKLCWHSFLHCNETLTKLSLPNLTSCGNDFLHCNETLTKLSLPNLESCGKGFLSCNRCLTELSLPNLASCGGDFLYLNGTLTKLSLPKLSMRYYQYLLAYNPYRNILLDNMKHNQDNKRRY